MNPTLPYQATCPACGSPEAKRVFRKNEQYVIARRKALADAQAIVQNKMGLAGFSASPNQLNHMLAQEFKELTKDLKSSGVIASTCSCCEYTYEVPSLLDL